uniref:Ig-like domain-containing protein n=1 Tax=Gopherus evgoodei TaxID=1825980 RepID=A0A8C4Y870_9SAUR
VSSVSHRRFIIIFIGGANGESVTQPDDRVTVIPLSEGASLLLDCTYQSSVPVRTFWYVQYPTEAPRLFVRDSEEQDEEGDRKGFKAKHNKSSYPLSKSSTQLSDSAVYYCAMSPTLSHGMFQEIQKPPQVRVMVRSGFVMKVTITCWWFGGKVWAKKH